MPHKNKGSLYTTAWGQSVLVQRKKGLKRLSMRFSLKNKAFMVSAPICFPATEIMKFIDNPKTWFTNVLSKQSLTTVAQKKTVPGQIIQLLGNAITVLQDLYVIFGQV